MSNLVQLNEERLNEIVAKATEFTKDPSVESDIAELMQAQKMLETAATQVKAAFKERFMSGEMENSIEGDLIKVAVSQSGSIYKLIDGLKADPSLLKVDLDSKAVAAWVEKNQVLPEGIEYNQNRSLSIRITTKG